jgi:hypothetical protein
MLRPGNFSFGSAREAGSVSRLYRSRVASVYPTCNFAVPVFCNPARDMSNVSFLPLVAAVLRASGACS